VREPGGEASETLATGLAAAVAGGFTAVCPMPNTRPVNDSPESTRAMIERARALGLARVFPIAAVSMASEGQSLTDFQALVEAGAVAFSDDGRPVKTAGLMRRALEEAQALGVAIIDHCEDASLSGHGAINEGAVAARLGLRGIPASSEDVGVARDLVLAESTGARLHVAHLSTRLSLEMVRAAKGRGVRVTCEVTPHHAILTDEAVAEYGTNAKMNPPLRSLEDVEALRAGIAEGALDLRHEPQELADPHAVVERRIFRHVANERPSGERIFADLDAADAHSSRRGRQIAGEDAQDRALARSVRPEKADNLAFIDRKRDAAHRDAAAITLHQIFDDDNALSHRSEARNDDPRATRRPRVA
jgi:dihydroorotase